MPPRNNSNRIPEPFLLGQPVKHLEADDPIVRWKMGIVENDPTEESDKSEMARRGVEIDDPELAMKDEVPGTWKRIDREQMIKYAVSDDPAWRRVAMVCGAGLGKTTNLQWLEARINRQDNSRSKHLAVFLTLDVFKKECDGPDKIVEWLVKWLLDRTANTNAEQMKYSVIRMLSQGRVTFLLDSLDQAQRDVIPMLQRLVTGRWSQCRVWVSGRPYAFRIPSTEMQQMARDTPWQFLRIGRLDEPECRQLLETTKRPGSV